PVDGSAAHLIYQEWQSGEAFRTYWKSPELTRFYNQMDELLVSGPDLRLYFGGRQEENTQGESGGVWWCGGGLSRALSLFGAQQMTSLLGQGSGRSMQTLRNAAAAELNEPFRAAFRAGDALQRGLLDIARGGLNGEIFDPARWMRMFTNVMQPQAEQ